jgi:hypothetical protein
MSQLLEKNRELQKRVKYMFIHEHKNIFAARLMCVVLGVCKSAYYSSLKRKPGKREQQNRVIDVSVERIN